MSRTCAGARVARRVLQSAPAATMPRRWFPLLVLLLSLSAPSRALAGGGPAQPRRAPVSRVALKARTGIQRWSQKKVKLLRNRLAAHKPAVRRTLWRGSAFGRALVRGRDRRRGAHDLIESSERMRDISRELKGAGATDSELPGVMEHVSLGFPSRASADNPEDKLLVQSGYVTSYNRQRKTPNWVATKLTRSDVTGLFNKRLKFKRNQKLPDTWEPAGPNDYRGAFASARLTRGHLVGSGDQTSDPQSHADTYLMTNQVPQLYDNNAGPWHDFEVHLRQTAMANDVYIFAGGVFDHDSPTIGQHEVAVPKATWKVAVVVPRGASFDSPAAKAMYLIVPNEPGKVSLEQTFDSFLVSGQEMEHTTGLRFFTSQTEEVRQKFLTSTYHPHVPVHYYSRRKIAEIRKMGLELPANVQLDPRERSATERVVTGVKTGTMAVGRAIRPASRPPSQAEPERFFQP
jgi:endonuclease G